MGGTKKRESGKSINRSKGLGETNECGLGQIVGRYRMRLVGLVGMYLVGRGRYANSSWSRSSVGSR